MGLYPVDYTEAGTQRPREYITSEYMLVYFLALPLKQTIEKKLQCSRLGNQYTEDVFERTILTALQHYDKWKSSPNQYGWLYRTACFHILHLERKNRRIISWEEIPFDYLAPLREDIGLIELMPQDICAEDATLLFLRYQYELPICDIARILQLSDAAVKKRLIRLRIRMRGKLKNNG